MLAFLSVIPPPPLSSHTLCLKPLHNPADLPKVMDVVEIDHEVFPKWMPQLGDAHQIGEIYHNLCSPPKGEMGSFSWNPYQ